jgi:hypothetical protein
MIKYILLATTMCIASPAFAQETTVPDTQTQDQTPVTEPVAPVPETPQPAEPATPATPAPVAEAVAAPAPAETAAPAAPVAAAAPATPAAPATSQDQVAQVVTTEFASYDKDADGALNQAEFAAWMVALRKASDPAFAAETPAGQAWLAAAFTQADADKNAGVNATELTSFLTPKPAA